MPGSFTRASKKPSEAWPFADITEAGLKVQSLTLPGNLAVIPFAATARSTSTFIVLVSVAPRLSVTVISSVQGPEGSWAMAAAPSLVKPI